jgi:hypothetical protein
MSLITLQSGAVFPEQRIGRWGDVFALLDAHFLIVSGAKQGRRRRSNKEKKEQQEAFFSALDTLSADEPTAGSVNALDDFTKGSGD